MDITKIGDCLYAVMGKSYKRLSKKVIYHDTWMEHSMWYCNSYNRTMQNIRNALKPYSACLCIWIGIRLQIRNDSINDRSVYHSQLINRQGQHGPLWQTAYIKLNGERTYGHWSAWLSATTPKIRDWWQVKMQDITSSANLVQFVERNRSARWVKYYLIVRNRPYKWTKTDVIHWIDDPLLMRRTHCLPGCTSFVRVGRLWNHNQTHNNMKIRYDQWWSILNDQSFEYSSLHRLGIVRKQ